VNKTRRAKHLIVVAIAIVATLLMVIPIPGYSHSLTQSAAVILITLTFWSTGILPPFLTGLIFYALSVIFNLIDANTLFSGFGSTAVWLIISGFVIGSAIAASGLSGKLAGVLSPHLAVSYPRLIGGLVLSAVVLGFIMPSSVGRAVVLIPIGMALADKVGFRPGSNGRLGIATALAIACNMPSFAILPSNIPNMILAGASENLFGVQFGYMEYLLLHFPILGALKSTVIVFLVLRIFPDQIMQHHVQLSDAENSGQVSQQIKLALILGVTLLLWATDSIHGINPAWVGLTAAILLLLPKWGIVAPQSFNQSIDFGTVIFVAAALGLGALVNHSGMGETIGQMAGQYLPLQEGRDFLNFMSLSLLSVLTGLVTTIPGVPTVLTPLAQELASTSGLTLSAVLMTQVVGFSTVIFPYQVGPLIVAMGLSKERISELLKITLPLTLITVVVLFPLDYFWWFVMGYFQ
jgi:di/tricarboxylate transporter